MNRFQRSRIRKIMRGYAQLKKQGKLGRMMETQNALQNIILKIPEKKLSKQIFKNTDVNPNNIVKQFLFQELGGVPLNKALLKSLFTENKKIIYPLPEPWRNTLSQHGWKVADINSEILWQKKIITNFFKGVLYLFKNLIYVKKQKIKNRRLKNNYVYFCNLGSSAYFRPKVGPKAYNLFSWYVNWSGKSKLTKFLFHDEKQKKAFIFKKIKICSQDLFLAPCEKIKFLVKGLQAAFQSGIDLYQGVWYTAFLFPEIIKDLHFQCQESAALEYWFHNGSSTRPLWTYTASKNGAKINYFFFATNTENFKTTSGYDMPPPFYKNMTWDHYLVWDKQQSDFLQRCGVGKELIQIVGPIWAFDSNKSIPKFRKSIAVFDVPPRRPSIYVTLGLPVEYYVNRTCIQFIQDIVDVAAEKKLMVLWKGKHNMTNALGISKIYLNRIKNFSKVKNFIPVDPQIAPQRVIKQCCMTISLPFTSPSLIARQYKKPSFFYDPTQWIQKNDRAAGGIPIVSGKKELRSIIARYI